MHVREATPNDAKCLISLIKNIESEAEFMLMEEGERQTTPEQMLRRLEIMEKESNSTIFVAVQEEGKLIGYLIAVGGNVRRTKHTAYLVIGILQDYRGLGTGTKLFQSLEEWAISHHISRLELTVVTENVAGVTLYKKMGFEIEGTKRHSLLIDGTFFDEYYMSKLLS